MKRTMEKGMKKINLLFLLITTALINFVSCVEVSSQIDLESQENEQVSDRFGSKLAVNLSKTDGRAMRMPWDFKSPVSRLNNGHEFVRSDSFKRSYFIHNDSTKQPNVVNNIRIVLSGNETKPNTDKCQNGVCDVSVSSKRDGEGNIITDVHLSIVTKLNTDSEVKDIPVVDGMRGVEDTHNPSYNFHRRNPLHPMVYLSNDIPQIQTRYRGVEPMYRTPQNTWRHRSLEESANRKPQHRAGWSPGRPIVDDKIESPLSKTETS